MLAIAAEDYDGWPAEPPERDREWMTDALCALFPPHWWWEGASEVEAFGAGVVCEFCPVAEHCLTFGLLEEGGIWGGLDEDEREAERRRRRLSPKVLLRDHRRALAHDQTARGVEANVIAAELGLTRRTVVTLQSEPCGRPSCRCPGGAS